ncbi:MAG: cell division protein SepF [Candidatus Micrarchaeota archaeon]|nr:cell division protein SepF [Candidatus Micrarchaeota archaeon]
MGLKGIFSKDNDVDFDVNNIGEEYFEVNVMNDSDRSGKLSIAVENLADFSDTDRILRAIRSGHVVFLKIKEMKEKDIGELKRSVEKLKKTVVANNGNIVGVDSDWLLITPEYAALAK